MKVFSVVVGKGSGGLFSAAVSEGSGSLFRIII